MYLLLLTFPVNRTEQTVHVFLLMGPISEKVDKALAFLFGFCPQA